MDRPCSTLRAPPLVAALQISLSFSVESPEPLKNATASPPETAPEPSLFACRNAASIALGLAMHACNETGSHWNAIVTTFGQARLDWPNANWIDLSTRPIADVRRWTDPAALCVPRNRTPPRFVSSASRRQEVTAPIASQTLCCAPVTTSAYTLWFELNSQKDEHAPVPSRVGFSRGLECRTQRHALRPTARAFLVMSDAPPPTGVPATTTTWEAPEGGEFNQPPSVRFAVLGDAFLDISVGPLDSIPVPGSDVEVELVSQHPGGSALNTAWHLAAQGVEASLFAAVGRDRGGKTLLDALQSESNVKDPSATLAVLKYQPTATCVAMFGQGMDRTFISAPGAAKVATLAQLLPNGMDALDVTHVHIGGFYACPGVHGGLVSLVKKLRDRDIKVSMDPNFDPNGEWRSPAMRHVLRGESAVDLFMPSEVEACEITGRDTAEEALEALVGDDRSTSDAPVKLAVIKRGANGVLAGDCHGRRWSAPACTVSRVVDTNGAGDAFNAGFLRVWAQGGAVDEALRAGCASAAIAAQHTGAVGDWAPTALSVDAQAEAEYGEKQWWQKGILACMAPRKLA